MENAISILNWESGIIDAHSRAPVCARGSFDSEGADASFANLAERI